MSAFATPNALLLVLDCRVEPRRRTTHYPLVIALSSFVPLIFSFNVHLTYYSLKLPPNTESLV